MKKRKRDKLNRIKDQKRLEWERVKTMQEDNLRDDCHVIELDVDAMMDIHFMDDEYGCDNCEDYLSEVCEGEGYTTYNECYKCMKQKFEDGDRIMMMTNMEL